MPISFAFYTIYNSFTFIWKNELYLKRFEKVSLDEIKWTPIVYSSELRYVKLDTCLHQFLCHVTFDIKFFHYLFTSYYQILFTLLMSIYEHETTFFEGKSYINLLLNKNS